MNRNVVWPMLLTICALAMTARAENRALIIGIGMAYNPPDQRILGPAQDVALATALAQQLGFREAHIKILPEEKATKDHIVQGLQWLLEGVQAGEKAFIHYSGHGTRLSTGDGRQGTGCTAALVPVDFDGTSVRKLLTAAEFNRYLQPLRERATVILFLDACFSGGITKGLYVVEDKLAKYYEVKGASQCNTAVNDKALLGLDAKAIPPHDQLVGLTATADNELAFGDLTRSGKGSLFTQALYDRITAPMQPGQRVTFNALREWVTIQIHEVSRRFRKLPHTPQLIGNAVLFAQDVQFSTANPPPDTTGSLDDARDTATLLTRLVRASKFQVAIQAHRTRIHLGQDISLTFRSSKDGYLNLVEIEPNGNLQVIFPNKYKGENQVKALQAPRIPEDIGGFRFEAKEPVGQSRIVALVTRNPLNLYTRGTSKTLEAFTRWTVEDFKSLKDSVCRSIDVKPPRTTGATEETGEFGAADVLLDVVKKL